MFCWVQVLLIFGCCPTKVVQYLVILIDVFECFAHICCLRPLREWLYVTWSQLCVNIVANKCERKCQIMQFSAVNKTCILCPKKLVQLLMFVFHLVILFLNRTNWYAACICYNIDVSEVIALEVEFFRVKSIILCNTS